MPMPRKPFGGMTPFGTGAVVGAAGGGMIGDLAAGGTPSNLGKIGDAGTSSVHFKRLSYKLIFILKSFGRC